MARLQAPIDDELAHALQRFDCVVRYADGQPDPGELMVREFLVDGAMAGALTGTSTTFLALDPQLALGVILGYVTLTLSHIRLTGGEKRAATMQEVWGADFGALRIAMIGTDHNFAGRGYGFALLQTAIRKVALMSAAVSVRFIIADAVDTQKTWYERQGFVENRSQAESERLARAKRKSGIASTSMRLDLGADPRLLAA